MIDGFKKFILRGNVIDLAVGVIIGAAFGGIVDSLTKDIITPLIGKFGGEPDFSAWKVDVFMIGNFLNTVVSFLIKAAALYFVIVLPFNAVMDRMKKEEAPAPPPGPTPTEEYLKEIRDLMAKQRAAGA
jgi:large conductance mechanosensitive channel